MIHEIATFLVNSVDQLWYFWIVILMFIESSFFPFPSEIVMIPAWYLAAKSKMNIFLVIFCWIAWSLLWSYLNYFLAKKFWRNFILKIFSEEKVAKLDKFFQDHWEISTFNWRLIPWIRQLISFPAWLAKMNLARFTFFTWLWAWIWVIILVMLWYFIWENQEMVNKYLKELTIFALIFITILSLWYLWYKKYKK